LNRGLRYTSGPEWLYDDVLHDRWVLAVAGTHGKTTTTGMLAWILEAEGLEPGFLIGGVPLNFGLSARLGGSRFFVIEADEYDTAFFDKRSKFVHYRPRTAILNNLEYDHADIFPDLAAIQRQFHHLVRTVPGEGLIVLPASDVALADVLRQGCWTPVQHTRLQGEAEQAAWEVRLLEQDASHFGVFRDGERCGEVHWTLTGLHNARNAVAAIAAAVHAGVPAAKAVAALGGFHNVKRRLEVRGQPRGITLYDDFAHHPTAILTTLQGLRARVGAARIIAVLEPRSNTMRMGIHVDSLAEALAPADRALIYQSPDLGWDAGRVAAASPNIDTSDSIDDIVGWLRQEAQPGDHVVFMSNGGFGGIHGKAEQALETAAS
jgi:UDP-N-acetylmuramate: L-alanyl-gamma-D-glutamyl-meso-diaminopimelate ligase